MVSDAKLLPPCDGRARTGVFDDAIVSIDPMGLSALEVAAGLSVAWLFKVILQKYVALTSVSDDLK